MSEPVLVRDLFQQVLVAPALELGATRLQIVSGYATASMANRHMGYLSELDIPVSIELIVGMIGQEGIDKKQHIDCCKYTREGAHGLDFSCRYVIGRNPVHAKAYVWLTDQDVPIMAFSGSANYTHRAFSQTQTENMVNTACPSVQTLYGMVKRNTVGCLDKEEVSKHIKLLEPRQTARTSGEKISLSLLTRRGDTHAKAGLNWGQRGTRNKNEAYIPIPADIRRRRFFPPLKKAFNVATDDDDSFIFVVAQMEGKALETKQSNALLGEYLRARMGLPSGKYVTREDLEKYGRTDVSFTKLDDGTYLMDFGV